MSWLYSRALVEAYSEDISLGGEPSVQSSATPTPQAYWSHDRTMERSPRSLSGTMFGRLTADRGADLLTWFQAGFRVRISPSPDLEPASTANEVDYGARWRGSFAKWDRVSCSWRTHQLLLVEDSTASSVIWPRWGMMRDGVCSELTMSAHLIGETESGSSVNYPTPTTMEEKGRFNTSRSPNAKHRPTLGTMAKHGLWPTPTVCGNYNRKGSSATSGDGLATAVRSWPTPRATAGGGGANLNNPRGIYQENALASAVKQDGETGPLNPMWVEWLMGWPLGWTDLGPLETDKYQQWRRLHGEL